MKKFILFGLLITFISATPVWAVTTTPYDSAANLVSALLGPGIEVQNITYTGATVASGYFTGGAAAGIGINSGISLTSGYLTNVNGTVNNNDGITGNNGTPGSTQLNTIVSPQVTYDAVALSFQFKSIGDAAYFNYVFGSEEYNEFVDQYNDVFAFYLNGVNMALVPGTSQPVSINTVNKDDNAAFYNNNDPTDGTPAYNFQYDGFTDVFTVALTGLTPGQWYDLQLTIADTRDAALDSGVFLQQGSFSNVPVGTPEPLTLMLVGMGLMGLAGIRKKIKN